MAENDEIVTVARIVPDKAAAAAVIKTIDLVSGKLKGLGLAAANGVTRIKGEFRSSEREIKSARLEVEKLEAELRTLNSVSVRPTVDVQRSGGGREQSRLGRIDQTGRIGTQLLSGLGQGELANAVGLVGDLAGGIEDLGLKSALTLGGIGLLGAGLTALVSVVQKMVEEAQKEYDARVGVIKSIQDLTSAEANHAQAEAAIERENAQLALEYLEREKATQVELSNTAGLNLEQYAGAITKIEALNNLIREQELIVTGANATIGIYNELLAEGATLNNDTAAAAANAIATMEEANRITLESRKRIAELNREIAVNSAKAIRSVLESIASGLSEIPADLERWGELADKREEAEGRIYDLNVETSQAIERLSTDSQARQSAIIAEGNQQAGDLAEQYNHEREQGERDLQSALERIRRQAGLEQLDAIGNRDAVAFNRSKDAEALETEQAKDAADERADERDYQYKQEMQQLARSVGERLRAEQDGLRRSLQLEEEKYRKELEIRRRALNDATYQLQAFQVSTDNIMHTIANSAVTGLTTVQTAASNFITGMINEASRLASVVYSADQNASVGAAGSIGGYTTAQYAEGIADTGTRAHIAMVHPHERVLNARENRVYTAGLRAGGAGGFTFAPTINGANWGDIRRNMLREFDDFVSGYEAEAG